MASLNQLSASAPNVFLYICTGELPAGVGGGDADVGEVLPGGCCLLGCACVVERLMVAGERRRPPAVRCGAHSAPPADTDAVPWSCP